MQSIHDRIVMIIIITMAASLTSFLVAAALEPQQTRPDLGSSLWFKIKSSVFRISYP